MLYYDGKVVVEVDSIAYDVTGFLDAHPGELHYIIILL